MASSSLPAEDLRHLLVTLLAGAAGGTKAAWDARLGELVRVDLARSPQSNWTLTKARGSVGYREEIDHAVAVVRTEHPYVRW